MIKLNAGYALHSETYDSIETMLRDEIALDWFNAMTLVKLGRRFALNAARNTALFPVSARLSPSAFGDAPILVLGAGPSLDQASCLLSPDRGFRIVCVDTALKPLLDRGIRPDLVVALESQFWNLRDFIGSGRSGCPVAMDLSALPRGAAATGGFKFLFSATWTPLRLLDRMEKAGIRPTLIPPLGSVGLTAVSIALAAGTGPVVAAGLDFSYRIGEYHARSTPARIERLLKTDRFLSTIDPAPAFRKGALTMNGKDGIPVRSDPALRGYRNLFEREFGSVERLFDAGPRGLALGIPRLGLDEAAHLLDSPRRRDAVPLRENAIADARSTLDFIDSELRRLDSLRTALSGGRIRSDLEELIDDCDHLWAHFPECAGAEGKRPSLSDLSFLKRVRAEADVFVKAFTIARSEIGRS